MSVAEKEEVCSHQLGPRLGEPVIGMPIKKRPISLSDRSIASGMLLSMKPSSTATVMSVSAAAAGPSCSKEPFLNRSDTNVISKFIGVTNSHDQNHTGRSFNQSVSAEGGTLANGSTDTPPCGESDNESVAPVVRSQSQKFFTLDLHLTSCQSAKINYSSPVKREKLDQGFSIFPSTKTPKDVQTTSAMKSPSNSSLGKLSNLDLNVPLDPADHTECLPKMHEGCNELHQTFPHQKAQVPVVAPVSTISTGLSINIDSSLNLNSAYGLANKCGADDVTLDLQLQPPTRPELGINWKGLAPDPELSLSLSGNHLDSPKDLRVPDAIFKSEPTGSAKKISGGTTPGSDKSPLEKILKPVPCIVNHQTTMLATVSGNVETASSSLVKKEPEESSRQHNHHSVEKAPLSEQQSVRLVSNCAENGKNDNIYQVFGEPGFYLNSAKTPNKSAPSALELVTDSALVRTDKLHDVVGTENVCAVSDVQKFIKHEEITSDTQSPCQSAPLISKSLPHRANASSPAVELPATQSTICTSGSEHCNPVEASINCEQTVSHIHTREDVACKPSYGKEACDVSQSFSNPTVSLVSNYRNRAAFDGMSQGSASMDCSDDSDSAVSQLPTTNKSHAGPLGNAQITEVNNLFMELPKEYNNDIQHDCSPVTNQVHMLGMDEDQCVNRIGDIATHSGEEYQSEVSVDGKFKDEQSLTSDKNSPVNITDTVMKDVKIATGAGSADLRRSPALGTLASPKIDSSRRPHETLDNCVEKCKIPVIKSEHSQSPHGKQTGNCSNNNANTAAVKIEHGAQNKDIVEVSNQHPRDSVPGEDSHLDEASSSQPHEECTKEKLSCERSEHEKSKPDSCMASSVQNEKGGQVDGSHWRDMANAIVNRNERWERFMGSEKEKNKGEYHGGRHAFEMMNQRTDHRYGGRGAGYHGHPRNFRDPRMNNEAEMDFADEPIIGTRRPFEDDIEHLHRIPHRWWCSPPVNNQLTGCFMRDMDHDGFSGQMEDLPDDMMEDNFFIPHSHPHHALGDSAFINRERSHSHGQRSGAPMHFHRGRSPEVMQRSPPLYRTDRSYLPHQHHTRRHGPPLDRTGHDERDTQRSMRRCGVGVEDDGFIPPMRPTQLAELRAEAELTERRKFGDRRVCRRSLEESPVGDEEEMFLYHGEGDMGFAKGDGGPREPDVRHRNRLEHRVRGEDGYRYRGHQGWHDRNSSDSRLKRRNCHSYE